MALPGAPRLRLWGAPCLVQGDTLLPLRPERRSQLLLLLALRNGGWFERDALAALLWPGRPAAEGRRNLRKVLFDARALPGTQALQAHEQALCWPVDNDVQQFHDAWRQGRLADALALAEGEPLQGFGAPGNPELSAWLAGERGRLVAAWQQAAHQHLAQRDRAAPPEQDLALARRLLASDGLDETALAAVMRAELARGQGAEAGRLFQGYERRLAHELGIEPSNSLRELWRACSAPGATAPGAPAGSSFVGRGAELAELQALLSRPECRLLTLLAPGGSGKSRLARQLLQRSRAAWPGGARWLELQDLADTAAATARLAAELSVTINDTGDTLAQLAAALPATRSLLVLDNAEHLSGLPAWARALLQAAPGLVLLCTSRQRLHIDGEWLLPLPGLAAPDEDSRDLEAAASFDAVRLFTLRAQASRPDFELAPHLPAVLDIVQVTGGLPLALELAAGWVRLLPPAEIARDLRQSLDVLQRDPRQAGNPSRPEHESVHAMLESSWSRLGERERQALSAVAVFEGGFTRAAAWAVAGVGLPLLAALADRSLLQLETNGRFALHPLTAAWVAARLAAEPQRQQALRDAHAQHFGHWLAEQTALARGRPRLLIEPMHAEQANWAAAWRHAVAAELPATRNAMVAALRTYFENQGRLNEGLALLRPALACAAAGPAGRLTHARLVVSVASLLLRRGDLRDAEAMVLGALPGAREGGDVETESNLLNGLCLSLWSQGRPEEALQHGEHNVALTRRHPSPAVRGRALNNLSVVEKALGRYEQAQAHLAEVLALQRAAGNPAGLSSALISLGNLLRARLRFNEARPLFEEGLALCEAEDLRLDRPYHTVNLALVHQALAQPAEARRLFELALLDVRRSGLVQLELVALMGLARCASQAGEHAAATGRLREALRLALDKSYQALMFSLFGVWAECRLADGQPVLAARLWRLVAAQPTQDATMLEDAQTQLAALVLDEAAALQAAEPLSADAACALLLG